MRNEATAPALYNPFGIGNKPLVYVIERLRKKNLLKVDKGTPYFIKNEADEDVDPKRSSLVASNELIALAQQTISIVIELPRSYVELKTVSGKLIEFEPTPYTDHINKIMRDYCQYLNGQNITVDGESIEDIFLVRKYKDWSHTGLIQYGGRTHHLFMSYPKTKRSRILINGKETISVDYPASVANVLYKTITGRPLHPEDPYKVAGIPRSVAKKFVNIMLNSSDKRGVSGAVNTWLNGDANNKERIDYEKAVSNIGQNTQIINAIMARNKPIAQCFFKGTAMGQHYAWLEANLVFEVANYFAQHLDLPCLTVHDEFIIPEDRASGIEDYLYTVGLDEIIYRSKFY
jgi:hypothetical protein|tara:strand:- start:529 stop:1566 length:1038 start_codon:yes stop_codon:yes gene_type:complete